MITKIQNRSTSEASIAAKIFIEDFESGFLNFGSKKQKIKIEKKKTQIQKIALFIIILFLTYYFIFEFNKNSVCGYVVVKNKSFNEKIVFYILAARKPSPGWDGGKMWKKFGIQHYINL